MAASSSATARNWRAVEFIRLGIPPPLLTMRQDSAAIMELHRAPPLSFQRGQRTDRPLPAAEIGALTARANYFGNLLTFAPSSDTSAIKPSSPNTKARTGLLRVWLSNS